MSTRIFASLSGARTIARLFSAPNQVIYGTYDPIKPTLPLFTPDGSTAYGFKQFFNGYVFGPEGTSLAQLQDAVDAGQLPMIHPNSANVYPRLTVEDYLDAMYINVGGLATIYSMYVKPVPASVVPTTPTPTTPTPVPVTLPPVVDPCQTWKDQVTSLQAAISDLEGNLDEINDLARLARNAAKVDLSGRGGGAPVVQLRKLINKIAEITGPL